MIPSKNLFRSSEIGRSCARAPLRWMIPSRRKARSPSVSCSATAPGSATASSIPAPPSTRRSTSAACTIHDRRWREMVDVLAGLPLIYQPGTSWEYSLAIDVVARLVEVISGQSFDQVHQGADPRSARHGRYRLRRSAKGSRAPRRLLRRRGPDGADEAGPDPNRRRALPRRLSAPHRTAQWRRRPGLNDARYGGADPKPAARRQRPCSSRRRLRR